MVRYTARKSTYNALGPYWESLRRLWQEMKNSILVVTSVLEAGLWYTDDPFTGKYSLRMCVPWKSKVSTEHGIKTTRSAYFSCKFSIRSFWELIRMFILIQHTESHHLLLWPYQLPFDRWPFILAMCCKTEGSPHITHRDSQRILPETPRTETDDEQEPCPFSGCQHGRPSPANNEESQWSRARVKFGDSNVGLSSSNQINHIPHQEPISRMAKL